MVSRANVRGAVAISGVAVDQDTTGVGEWERFATKRAIIFTNPSHSPSDPGTPFKQNRELNGSSNDVSGSALISLAVPREWGPDPAAVPFNRLLKARTKEPRLWGRQLRKEE